MKPKNTKLAHRIRVVRTRKNLSYHALACRVTAAGIPITGQAIANYENCVNSPSIERIRMIAQCLDKPLEYFI